VREHLFRAFSFGRTAKGIFAVRLLHSAWGKKCAAKKLFAVRFNLNARQRNSLTCVFLLAHDKQFFPHRKLPSLATVTLCTFVVR
jgi:hypothetical protein